MDYIKGVLKMTDLQFHLIAETFKKTYSVGQKYFRRTG